MLDINYLRLTQVKHQELLKEAELRRQIRRARGGQPSRMTQLRNQLGAMLTHWGQRLHKETALPSTGRLQNNA
jgi:hypothetical protein